MSSITALIGSDGIITANSMTKINTNFSNLNTDKFETSNVDTDTTLAANSDSKVASQKAVKAYIAAAAGTTYLVPTGAILPYGAATAPSNFLLCDGAEVSRSTYSTLFGVIGTTYGVGNGSTTFNTPNLKGRFPLGYAASANTKTFTFASRSGNVITVTGADNHANNELQTGQAILYDTTSGAITGLTDNTTYYVVRVAYNQFSLATSVANANAGTVISLSSDGSGTQTFVITYTARSLGHTGGEETHALTDSELPSHRHDLETTDGAGAGNTVLNDSTGYNGGTGANIADIVVSTGNDTPHNIMNPFVVVNYIIKT